MSRLPGPVCTVLSNWEWVDKSTLCRVKGKPPGTNGKKQVSEWVKKLKKLQYLGIARGVSYAMQGKSLYQSGRKTYDDLKGNKQTQRVQSYLGGQFLRMYLDANVDPEIVKDAGKEIGESQEFAALEADTQKYLQARAKTYHKKPFTDRSLAYHAENYLKTRKNSKGSIVFKKTLNTVVGGITNVDVRSAKFTSKKQVRSMFEVEYEFEVIIHDEYDFENRRFGFYDQFRKQAASLLIADDFDAFEKMVFGQAETAVFESRKAKLDDAAVFASFMFALEKKKWTPGPLAWQVAVPMRGTIKTNDW